MRCIFITHPFTKYLRKYVLSRTSGNTWVCGWNCWHSKEQVFQLFKILCCTSYHSFLCNGIVSMWPRKSGFKNSRGDGFLSCWKWPPNLLWNCTLKRLPKTAVRQIIEMYVLMHWFENFVIQICWKWLSVSFHLLKNQRAGAINKLFMRSWVQAVCIGFPLSACYFAVG